MTLTLFHSPGSCSDGIAYLLAELDVPHHVHVVNLPKGEHLQDSYRAANPKGKVPALRRADGSILTEFQAISFWLGRSFPQAGLIGDDLEDQARILELMDFMVASVHMRGFTFMKVPQKFIPDAEAQKALRAHGRAEVEKGLRHLSEVLGDKDFLMGRLTLAEAPAIYLLRWAVAAKVDMPDNMHALHDRLMARPAAQIAFPDG